MRGRCELTIRIGSLEISQPMWVADIQDPCILGTDFLEPLGCVVNLRDSILSLGDEEALYSKEGESRWRSFTLKGRSFEVCSAWPQNTSIPP